MTMNDGQSGIGAPSGAPILSAFEVGKSFGALRALADVTLDLHLGEAVGIVGPNGAGKSTLLGALSGAYPPSEGRIEFNGRDVTYVPAAQMCKLGLVRTHQVPKPFGGL